MTDYQSYRIQIDDINISLIPGFIDQFWTEIMSPLPDDTVVYILVRVNFNGPIRNFSYRVDVTRDIKFKDVLYRAIWGQMDIIQDKYETLIPSHLIFSYFILNDENSKVVLPNILNKVREDLLKAPSDFPLPFVYKNLPNPDKHLFLPNGSIKINDYSFLPYNMDFSK